MLMCEICVKYQYASPAVCAYAHVFFFGNEQGVRLLEHGMSGTEINN